MDFIFLIRKYFHFRNVYLFIVSVNYIISNMQKENEKKHTTVITIFYLGFILKNLGINTKRIYLCIGFVNSSPN